MHTLNLADHIFIQERLGAGLYDKASQVLAVFVLVDPSKRPATIEGE